MSRYMILATILLVAGLVITFRPKSLTPIEPQSSGRNQSISSTIESSVQLPSAAEPSHTKSKNRIHYPKPTIEETTGLVRNTIIPLVDIQDQTILEVGAAINGFIQEAGIPPHQLRVVVNKSDDLVRWRIKEVRIRKVPLSVLLKYVCDSTRLFYRVEPGIIRFYDRAAEPVSEIPKIGESILPKDMPFAPDDPFAEP